MHFRCLCYVARSQRLRICALAAALGALFSCLMAVAERPVSEAQRKWWAFQALSDPAPPKVANESWVRTDIDRFVLAKLEGLGLSPAPDADRRAWLRRAKFALVGLPSTAAEIDSFVRDNRPDACERVIDQWLASPQFGEHWGRYWLDIVRYTDYLGPRSDDAPDEGDVELFEAYRYRDWVVAALNRDMPFNEFIMNQLAGDQLPAPAGGEINADGLIATTLLSIGVWDNGDADKAKIVSDIVDDQINVTGQAFLGLTLACARCHDHKFDPISTEDYYGLAGIFYSTRTLKALGPVGLSTIAMHVPLVPKEYVDKRQSQVARLAQLDKFLMDGAKDNKAKTNSPAATTAAANASSPAVNQEQRAQLEQERKKLQHDLLPAPATALAVQDGGTPEGLFPKNGDVPIHMGGRYDQLGKVVPRHLPTFFCGTEQAPIATGSGRMELARWIASPKNPLTPRVIVNRVWLKLFGQGLVSTPNNFGLLGEPPSHPELLDWLTSRFIAEHWSLKQLIRTIMRSSAYRQSALDAGDYLASRKARAIDPANRWLGRFASRRLSAEELRDSMLAVAGRLDLQLGGKATMDLNRPRRSLYIQTVRADRRNFSTLFDAADPSQCVGLRNVTTVAPQALFMLNNAFVTDNAKHFAAKLVAEIPNDERARIHRAYEELYGRSPTENEVSVAEKFLAAATKRNAAAAWADYIHVLFCTSEFCYVD
jgi:hypothetical protein